MAIKIRNRVYNKNIEQVCTKCYKLKPLDEFYVESAKKSGRTTVCKLCLNVQHAQHYLRNREKILKKMCEDRLAHSLKQRRGPRGRIRKRVFIVPPERFRDEYLEFWSGRNPITGVKIEK